MRLILFIFQVEMPCNLYTLGWHQCKTERRHH